MIQTDNLTKKFGPKTAVGHMTVTVRPGKVTGFLGPNGAGKSTTMKLIMGLERPTAGSATVNGYPIQRHKQPLTEVGALLEPRAFPPDLTARAHLQALAVSNRLSRRRVDEVLELVGLTSVSGKRTRTFSLGMAQRLGIAAALIGDPATILLDEPINGLDPDGVLWVRQLVQRLAAEGRTVFISSHLMSEMALTADHLVVLGAGKLLADQPISQIIGASGPVTRVRSPQAALIARTFAAPDTIIKAEGDDVILITGVTSDRVGQVAAEQGWVLCELVPIKSSLETAFFDLTEESTEYRATHDVGVSQRTVGTPASEPTT